MKKIEEFVGEIALMRVASVPGRQEVKLNAEQSETFKFHLENYQGTRDYNRLLIEGFKLKNKKINDIVNSYIDEFFGRHIMALNFIYDVIDDDFVPKDWWRIFIKYHDRIKSEAFPTYLIVSRGAAEHLLREQIRIGEAEIGLKKATKEVRKIQKSIKKWEEGLKTATSSCSLRHLAENYLEELNADLRDAELEQEEAEDTLKRRQERIDLIKQVIPMYQYQSSFGI